MSVPTDYEIPRDGVALTGPVQRPAPGTLPLRGDLAHVALAGRFLAAHYVQPLARRIGAAPAIMRRSPRADSVEIAHLDAGAEIEALDYSGGWAWVACGPDGPSGYVTCDELAPEDPAPEDPDPDAV